MENKEKSIGSEVSEIKDAIKSQEHKIDKIYDTISDELKSARDEMKKHIEEAEKDRDRKMKEIRYVGVEFEPTDVKKGQAEVNEALKAGFEPIRDFPTARGIVMVLGLWGDSKRTD